MINQQSANVSISTPEVQVTILGKLGYADAASKEEKQQRKDKAPGIFVLRFGWLGGGCFLKVIF